jgi:hypothetical protein
MDDLLDYFISAYGFLLHHDRVYTFKEWAEEIAKHYSPEDNRNYAAWLYLSSIRNMANTIKFSITRKATVVIIK